MSYSDVRIYMRPVGRDVERADIEDLFKGYGKLVEVKLMSGFGFVEFESPRDAQDVVAEFNGKDFMGERLQIEFAKVQRRREEFGRGDRDSYGRGGRDFRDSRDSRIDRRPRRSGFRLKVSGLPSDCSWQDLKDFARRASIDVLYADVSRDRDGTGVIEVEREADLGIALDKLANEEIKGAPVSLKEEIVDMPRERSRSRSPYRRSSPPPRRSYGRYGDDDGYRRRDRSRSPRRDRDRRGGGDRGYDRRGGYGDRDRGDRDRGDRDRGDRDHGDRRDRDRDDDRAPLPPPSADAPEWDRDEPKPAEEDFNNGDAAGNDTW